MGGAGRTRPHSSLSVGIGCLASAMLEADRTDTLDALFRRSRVEGCIAVQIPRHTLLPFARCSCNPGPSDVFMTQSLLKGKTRLSSYEVELKQFTD